MRVEISLVSHWITRLFFTRHWVIVSLTNHVFIIILIISPVAYMHSLSFEKKKMKQKKSLIQSKRKPKIPFNFIFSGGIFNRSYLLADENHNHAKGNTIILCLVVLVCFDCV